MHIPFRVVIASTEITESKVCQPPSREGYPLDDIYHYLHPIRLDKSPPLINRPERDGRQVLGAWFGSNLNSNLSRRAGSFPRLCCVPFLIFRTHYQSPKEAKLTRRRTPLCPILTPSLTRLSPVRHHGFVDGNTYRGLPFASTPPPLIEVLWSLTGRI